MGSRASSAIGNISRRILPAQGWSGLKDCIRGVSRRCTRKRPQGLKLRLKRRRFGTTESRGLIQQQQRSRFARQVSLNLGFMFQGTSIHIRPMTFVPSAPPIFLAFESPRSLAYMQGKLHSANGAFSFWLRLRPNSVRCLRRSPPPSADRRLLTLVR